MKRHLFNAVLRFVDGYGMDKEQYVREYYSEDLLLDKIFYGARRFLWPRWWAQLLVVSLIPKD